MVAKKVDPPLAKAARIGIVELKACLATRIDSLKAEKKALLTARLEGSISAFPFNEFEYSLMFLLDNRLSRLKITKSCESTTFPPTNT
jgi:hypothetical protein